MARLGAAYLIAAGGCFTIAPVGAWADTGLGVPVISQLDSNWAGAVLGTSSTETVGSAGCAITATAMVLAYYSVRTDPGSLNSWLTANGGYADDDLLIWDQVDQASGGRVAFSGWLGPDLTTITAELDAGRPVIAEVTLNRRQHFVVLTGYTGSSGYTINDPWFADRVNFADRYGDAATAIVSIRTYLPQSPSGFRGAGGPRVREASDVLPQHPGQ